MPLTARTDWAFEPAGDAAVGQEGSLGFDETQRPGDRVSVDEQRRAAVVRRDRQHVDRRQAVVPVGDLVCCIEILNELSEFIETDVNEGVGLFNAQFLEQGVYDRVVDDCYLGRGRLIRRFGLLSSFIDHRIYRWADISRTMSVQSKNTA